MASIKTDIPAAGTTQRTENCMLTNTIDASSDGDVHLTNSSNVFIAEAMTASNISTNATRTSSMMGIIHGRNGEQSIHTDRSTHAGMPDYGTSGMDNNNVQMQLNDAETVMNSVKMASKHGQRHDDNNQSSNHTHDDDRNRSRGSIGGNMPDEVQNSEYTNANEMDQRNQTNKDSSSQQLQGQAALMHQNYSLPGITSSIHSLSTHTTGAASIQQSFSLPPELKQILHEVARTGKCTSLPWTATDTSSFNAKRSLKKRRSTKRRQRLKESMLNGLTRTGQSVHQTWTGTFHNSAKLERNPHVDDNSSVKSNTSKVSNASKIEKKVVIETPVSMKESTSGSYAPSHADSSSVLDTASLASQGSKRSVDLSVSTRSAHTELKRRRFYRDQSCASSCSESVSSAGGGSTMSIPSSSASMGPLCLSLPFRTLRGALRLAVALVLEYSYKHRGGYKLSPAEKRSFAVAHANGNKSREKNSSNHPNQTDVAFMERRMRLLKMLGGGKSSRSSVPRVASGNASEIGFTSDTSFDSSARRKTTDDFCESNHYGPPFTIQRVAEVLLMPERYYVQTHKLCNALEKLLLVTSPSTAFGGVTGGDTSQNRREEREMTALADKKERDETEHRERNRRISSSSADGCDPIIQMNVSVETPKSKRITNANPTYQITSEGIAAANAANISNDQDRRLTAGTLLSDNRMLGVMTGDSVGLPVSVNMMQSEDNNYQHAMSVQNQGFAGRSDSFPPAALAVGKNMPDDAIRGLQNNVNVNSPGSAVLQHSPNLNRPPSPSLYSPSQGLNQLMNTHQTSDLQNHHSGVLDATACLRAGQNVQMEIAAAYLDQVDQGRSSASNSDIDSESDDTSFDDSASDRSDGSDFDPSTPMGLSETAARVMALNRMQQQHRREQYLQDRALRQVASFQPPPDSEYQSGDSIDSTMAEDSCGSDSSSSDFTD